MSGIVLTSTGVTSGFGGMGAMILYIVAIIGFFYFISIRPQKKEQERIKAMIDAMEVGDYVVTTSGFYGMIIDISDDMVIVEFGSNKNCRIPMKKSAITEIEKAASNSSADKEQGK
ncbi:MAG: preprotein translocase subunit YajC [Lachnospiraceae bacterium]|nr:preprotein translocase subunit YajC [Lachnospiraceae bacterium]